MAKPGDQDDEKWPRVAELRRIKVSEVSLVDRAANRRTFLLFKRDTKGGDREVAELTPDEVASLEEGMNTGYDAEDAVLKSLGVHAGNKLTPASANAVKAAVRLLKVASAEIGDEAVADTLAEAGMAAEASEPEAAPAAAKPDEEAPVSEPPVEKAYQAELAKRDAQIDGLLKFQASMLAKAAEAEAEAIVTEANLPGMAKADQVKLVKSLDPESRTMFVAWTKAIKATADEAALTQDIGSPRRGTSMAGTAAGEIEKRAKELIAKSADGNLTPGDAYMRILREDPELAARARAEELGVTA